MCKRLWKNAILALCVLGLVLQPVNGASYWQTVLQFNSNSTLAAGLNTAVINSFHSSLDDFSQNNQYITISSMISKLNAYIPIDQKCYAFIIYSTSNNTPQFITLALDGQLTKEGTNCYYDASNAFRAYLNPTIFNSQGVQSISNISYDLKKTSGAAYYSVYLPQGLPQGYYLVDQDIQYLLNYNAITLPTDPFVDNDGWQQDSVYTPIAQDYGDSFIGWAMYMCEQLYNNSSNYPPYIYGSILCAALFNQWNSQALPMLGDISQSIKLQYAVNYNIAQMMAESNFVQNFTDIADDINFVGNKLSEAFPDEQAEMNDAIADQILDDTNDTGLTVNRITSVKSDLDDGLSTFKLDTSGSKYSNPFSALDDADWSFWSQTTLNNLGSGYNYSFGAGSLMSEDDIFTENQNTLLDLLGW